MISILDTIETLKDELQLLEDQVRQLQREHELLRAKLKSEEDDHK